MNRYRQSPVARSIWSGTISFGYIGAIPVPLLTAGWTWLGSYIRCSTGADWTVEDGGGGGGALADARTPR